MGGNVETQCGRKCLNETFDWPSNLLVRGKVEIVGMTCKNKNLGYLKARGYVSLENIKCLLICR